MAPPLTLYYTTSIIDASGGVKDEVDNQGIDQTGTLEQQH